VDDLAATAVAPREAGAHFRGEAIAGRGGRQVRVDDPSGNPIE
jgi:hypothetical protein